MGGKSSKEIEEEKWRSTEESLKRDIFGQHIAVGEVYSCLQSHFYNENPKKALVIIVNGSLGTGKTYFANIIIKGIYENGYKDSCVKLFVGPRDFPDPLNIWLYQKKLKEDIETTVQKNPRSFFIFDEVDKMPIGMLDKITPYVDMYEKIDGTDYRKCVFLFLSNTGGERIDKIVLKQSAENKPREDLLLLHFRKDLREIVFDEQGGLKGSEIIKKRLIDHYLPFLPLEKRHIIDCLRVEFEKIKDSFQYPVDLSQVAELFEYYPEENPIFSEEGAKNVYIKIVYAKEFINKRMQLPLKPVKSLTSDSESIESCTTSLNSVLI